MQIYANWNGCITNTNEIKISAGNQSFRYGDGCFETMKMVNGKIILADLHFERLFATMAMLNLHFNKKIDSAYLLNTITELAILNNHQSGARIRLTIYRDGEDFEHIKTDACYIIQTSSLNNSKDGYNQQGLLAGIYSKAQKSCDSFSALKSNNYQPYFMARLWAQQQKLNDAIICNTNGRIADATIANIFIVANGVIKTPSLSEGCVNGVMRRYVMQCLHNDRMNCVEGPITIEELLNATEVFLTNAVRGIQWVCRINDVDYTNNISAHLYKKYIEPLYTNFNI